MLEGDLDPPKRFPNRERLVETFLGSRDSTKSPAAPGTDGVTANLFSTRLNQNIDQLYSELRRKNFHFSKLRPIQIPKADGRFRIICVPTVRDRLVQRTIINWLSERGKFPATENTFGVREHGLQMALNRAVELRSDSEWCVKTDIEQFFDNIKREPLKRLVASHLRNTSVLPLVLSAIDLEANLPRGTRIATIAAQNGLQTGRGIRQGMPLSPLLANISLSKFDESCRLNGINFIRYADDIIAFFSSKAAATAGLDFIRMELAKLDLSIPDLGSPKSTLVPPKQPVIFLGQELVYRQSVGAYVRRIGDEKLKAIRNEIKTEFSLDKLIREKNLNSAVEALTTSVRSYVGTYKGADNFSHFESEMRGLLKATVRGWLENIFSTEVIKRLSPAYQQFLGVPEELEVATVSSTEIAN